MKPEIKQRIEQINNGQVPNGYKNTDFGVFPCDWVTDKTFGDLFNFYGGLGKSRDELSENGVEYLHYGDMHRADFNIASMEQYSKLPKYDTNLKGDEPYLMQDGDVAFLDASEDLEGTSRAVLIDNPENKPFIAGLHIIHGKSKGNELSKYYKQYITQPNYIKKQFQKLASGFKVYGVNRNTISRIKCAYPKSTTEQEKIAEILMKWDEAIELQEKYIEKLKLQKSAYLSHMFPKKKEKAPRMRFKGFTDPWEQRKLGEVANTFEYGLNASAKEFDEINKYIRITDIDDESRMFLTDDITSPDTDLKLADKYKLEKDDILFARTGASVGKTYLYREKDGLIYYAGFLIRAKINSKNDAEFVFQNTLTDAYDSFIKITSQRSGQPGVNAQEYQGYTFYVPKLGEQQKIGTYLHNLDNLITLHQHKLEKIKSQRKVLQRYLLNGIVRIPR